MPDSRETEIAAERVFLGLIDWSYAEIQKRMLLNGRTFEEAFADFRRWCEEDA